MVHKIKIAILKADSLEPTVVEKFGDYDVLYKNLITNSCEIYNQANNCNLITETAVFDVINGSLPDVDDNYDAYLVSGSVMNAFDDLPWILRLVEFIKYIFEETSSKLFGVCFGHQIISRAFNCKTARNPMGWEVGSNALKLTKEAKEILNTSRIIVKLNQIHQDHVIEIPEGFINIGSTEKCQVQGLIFPKRVFTLQGHPEKSIYVIKEILDYRLKHGRISQEQYDEWVLKTIETADGVWFGAKMITFILDQ